MEGERGEGWESKRRGAGSMEGWMCASAGREKWKGGRAGGNHTIGDVLAGCVESDDVAGAKSVSWGRTTAKKRLCCANQRHWERSDKLM